MASHKLSLEIPDTLNSCVLRIVDMSVYDENLQVTCPRLQVSVPGFSGSYFVDVESGFARNFSACDLGVQTEDCGSEFADLPDKVYVFSYSVAPNDVVYVEYNHLRITKALNKIREFLCEIDQSDCEPTEEVRLKLQQIDYIRQYLMAAKAKVEVCRDVKKGLALYNYAWSKIEKLDCKTCK
jgi:hypothetical protein